MNYCSRPKYIKKLCRGLQYHFKDERKALVDMDQPKPANNVSIFLEQEFQTKLRKILKLQKYAELSSHSNAAAYQGDQERSFPLRWLLFSVSIIHFSVGESDGYLFIIYSEPKPNILGT